MNADMRGLSQMISTLDLSDAAIDRRKAFLEFSDEDVARLKQLHEILAGYAPDFASEFYRHLLSFEEMSALLPDVETLGRLQRSQAAYFEGLTAGNYGRDYIHHRVRVGTAHHRVGLSPTWYLGAYAKYLVGLLPEISHRLKDSPETAVEVVQSLIKIVLFDMGLAIDTYIDARDQTIRGLKNYSDMVFESMHDGILVLSSELLVLSANSSALKMFGLSLCKVLGRQLAEVIDCEGLASSALDVVRGGAELHDRSFCLHAMDSPVCKQARVTIRPICLNDERDRLLVVIEEVSEAELLRRQAELKLARSEALLRHAQSVAKIGSWSMDCKGAQPDAIEWSAETYRLFGVEPGTPIDYPVFVKNIYPADRKLVHEAWQRALGGEPYRVEHRIYCGEEIRWLEERAELEMDAEGNLVSVIGTVQDITERKTAEGRIEQFAFFDPLTRLPNRALFRDRLERALASAKRHDHNVALLFIDLDRFKEVNDTQGHGCGDLVLAEVAHRFRTTLRHDETLARLGGDEFVIIASETGRSGATLIAERLNRSLAKPIEIKGGRFELGASIGIALYPHDGEDAQFLLKHADIAMYRAKQSGGGYCFYDAEMGAVLARRLEVARRFGQALQDGVLQLHYQPQVDLLSGRLIGAEALLRWQDPEWGWVSPAEFIPIAEERGMMVAVGEWVLKKACRQIRFWEQAGLRLPARVAINVSAQQIEREDFAHRAQSIAREAGVDNGRIELEITESSVMLDPASAMKVTRTLVDAGFHFAIDDFGTGHSSLSYLKRFPASTLKVDMSFVRHMLSDRNDHSIVATIIAMAKSLGLATLAEGVETAEQAECLQALGCDKAQGYLYGRPMPPVAFANTWLTQGADPLLSS